MIKSKLLLDVFDIIFEDAKIENDLRLQIPFLSENTREHTGIGLFINFGTEKGIEDYKVPAENNENRTIDGKAIERINGVELRNDTLKILADVSVYVVNGFIDKVEIFNKNGEEYPTIEPTQYELHQVWLGSKKRSVIRNW